MDCKSERSIEDAQSTMGMGCTRVVERVMASIGNLSEVPTRPRHRWVCAAGVLWALPALLNNGMSNYTKRYFQSSEMLLWFDSCIFVVGVRVVVEDKDKQAVELQ